MQAWIFSALTLEEKGEVVFKDAHYLGQGMNYGYRSNLYSYGQLFIEVKLGHDTAYIESIEIISMEEMNRFLNQLKLPF